jgi:DNA polymerase III epsilon subunit-like protein
MQIRALSDPRLAIRLPVAKQDPSGRLLAIDFEASCLPRDGRSFPLEVALADGTGFVRSWLIRPDARWDDWHWSAEAERLHGLDRATVDALGRPVADVLAELAMAASGARVIADSTLDADWLATLAEAAGARPPFRVGHIVPLMDELGTTAAEAARAEARAGRLGLARHRAADDAQRLAVVIDSLAAAARNRRCGAAAASEPQLCDAA